MSTGYIFITAPSATYKTANKFLNYLRDWEYGKGHNTFYVSTTKNAYDLDIKQYGEETQAGSLTETNFQNAWAGVELKDLEAFCIDAVKKCVGSMGCPNLFILLDEKGLEDESCVLCERAYEFDEDEEVVNKDFYRKMRVPWRCVYISWANLNISNMSWEEIVDFQDGDEDGWYPPGHLAVEEDISDENKQLREEALRKFEEEGKI